jgi:transcriptional regulator with XRE-family HTH domain
MIGPMTKPTAGEVLKRLRGDVPQARLAEAIGRSVGYVGNVESGARALTADNIDRIAEALRLSREQTDELYAAAGHARPVASSPAALQPGEVALLRDVAAVLATTSERLLKLVDGLEQRPSKDP